MFSTESKGFFIGAAASLVFLTLAMYLQTLGFEYVWDDPLLFLDKTALVNEPLSWQLLVEPVLPGTSYMRPLVFLTLYAEFNLLGQSPMISHAVNLFIFVFNVLLVFMVCKRVIESVGLSSPVLRSWIAAILYVLHPALVESAAWISGRFDLMATFFMLLGVWIYLWQGAAILRLLGVAVAMMGALLSKELGVVFPALLLCVWMACNGRRYSGRELVRQLLRQNVAVLVVCAVVLFYYLMLRREAMSGIYHIEPNLKYIKMVWLEMMLPLEALKFYLLQSILPFYDIGPMHPQTYLDTTSLISRVLLVLVACYMAAMIFWSFWKRTPSSWFLMIWLGCLAPVLHIVPINISDNIGQERFLTLPLAFLVMAVVMVPYGRLLGAPGQRVMSITVPLFGFAWAGLALMTTLSVLPLWSNELTLWQWAYSHYPKEGKIRYNYLYAALKTGRSDIVEKEVAGWIESGDGLEVGEQLLYANLLVQRGDPEGMKYLEGVLYALPDFHNRYETFEQVGGFHLTGLQMAGAYADYANALLMFEGDAKRALEYNDIALWYLGESETIPAKYQRVAIYYALDQFDQADVLLSELTPLYYYKKEMLENGAVLLFFHFCKARDYQSVSCQKGVSRGMIPAPN